MRTPNASALTKIQTRLGTEPITIVEVDWDGAVHKYADKDFLAIEGKILSISGLDAIIKLGSGGASGDINVILDDTDSTIKTILDTNDIHKRPARIYQTYEGLSVGDEFLLFSGQVSSPIIWDEGQRNISFAIVNIIEDEELGFAPEDGEFDFVSEDAIGVPWPLCFGSVVRVPATKVTEATRGTSLTRYGQITAPELENLCALAIAAQQAESAKGIADLMPGFSTSNYSIIIDNLTSATINLNNALDDLIFDTPSQETDLKSYVNTCKELERWRIFQEQEIAKLMYAEQDRLPLESTPGKPIFTVEKSFSTEVNRNIDTLPVISFNAVDWQSFRTGKTITVNEITIRGVVPETIGLVEQATLIYNAYVAEHWPYSTPEEWEEANELHQNVIDLTADLDDAQSRSTAAELNINLANANIAILNTAKKALENDLLQIVLTEIIIENGEKFPQGSEVEIVINGMHFKGVFSDRTFTINQANTPADINVAVEAGDNPHEFILEDSSIQLKGKYCRFAYGIVFCENQDDDVCSVSPILYEKTGVVGDESLQHDIYGFRELSGSILETSVFLSKQWIDLLNAQDVPDYSNGLSVIRQRDFAIEVGDTVYLVTDYKELYVANLIPSTIIHEVMAYRVIDGVRKLVPVPSSYFTIDLNESIAGQNATTLRFKHPLDTYIDENWENTIYISLTSSVGPNTVDIIEHLVDTYTDLSKDTTSFTSVSTAINDYPSSFALLNRRGTLGAIEDIAWQARCVAYVKNQTVYLKYLAVEEAPGETIDESIIDRRTLKLTMTPSEDLVTEFVAEWDSDYSAEKRNKVVLRNNIPIYGTIKEEFDFFIYNIQGLVIKSATFWLIRMSNTWKIANFTTPINMLRLETFDTVELDLGQNWIASEAILGTVEEVIYNSESQELGFSVRTEVRSGFLTPYIFNWPSGVSIDIIYPTEDDPYAGT